MTTNKAATFHDVPVPNLTSWINRGLEFLWLLTIIVVPLAFVDRESILSESELAYVDVPKIVALRALIGLMAILWLIEWALQRRNRMGYPFTGWRMHWRPIGLGTLTGWLGKNPARCLTLAVVLYLINVLLSTLFSETFSVSMWGVVPGQDTYPAYTIICYVTLFGVVSTHVKSKSQVKRLLWAIALMALMVGVYSRLQFYGHDVFNLREIPCGTLLGSTLGNSILAGAVLLMTITVSLGLATIDVGQPVRSKRFWVSLGLWTVILMFQMSALILAFNRGPYGGAAVGILALLAMVAVFTGWRSVARLILVLVLAGALTAIMVLKPPSIAWLGAEGTCLVQTLKVDQEYLAPADTLAVASLMSNRIVSIGTAGNDLFTVDGGLAGAGLSGRIGIWETSGRLIIGRPWFDFDNSGPALLRHLIGYGPDMFKYTYLMESTPKGPNRVVVSERFAHNFLIHQGVELGLLGVVTTLSLFAVPILVGGYQLIRRQFGDSMFCKLVMVALLAALAARFVEQMVGVAAVSDLTIFWILLALFAALPAVAREQQSLTGPTPSLSQRHGARMITRDTNIITSGVRDAFLVAVVVGMTAGIGLLTWTKSINYLEAGFKARDGLENIRQAELYNALISIDRAIKLAPDVAVYHTVRAAVYSSYQRLESGPREPECDRLIDGSPYEACLARMNYLGHREAAQQRPFDWRSRVNLAESSLALALMERDATMASESIRHYREAARLDPQAWWHWEWLAAALINVGQPEKALEALDRSLAILDGTRMSASSRLLQGVAYLSSGEQSMAIKSFDVAIRLNPNLADAYTNRGASYNLLGEYELAIQDLNEAVKLSPEMAMAYNNRGNSYGDLNQLERAVEDYGQAIRLSPRFALSYSNRALAYTHLGRDEEALADIARGIELGLDPDELLTKINEARRVR